MVVALEEGESSTADSPALDLFTGIGNPVVLTDVATLAFRILDISTPDKLVTPVQVYPPLPAPPGTFFDLDPTIGPLAGVKLGVGHYFAPFTVPLDEALGAHKVEWKFKKTVASVEETSSEIFTVTSPTLDIASAGLYASVSDLREEGYSVADFSDARILKKIGIATRYIEKVTGRWFTPRHFVMPGYPTPDPTLDTPFLLDGTGRRMLYLEVPIIKLEHVFIENQAFLSVTLTEIELAALRVYNRHMRGIAEPDDRENPAIGFTVAGRIVETVASGLYPAPRIFPHGRQNVQLFGWFGYTDWDPTGAAPLGTTPDLIRMVCRRLVERDLIQEAKIADRLEAQNLYRVIQDHEGNTSIGLQQLWLRGGLTGDPEIDTILTSFRRPPRIGIA